MRTALAVLCGVNLAAWFGSAAAADERLPEFHQIEALVERHFAEVQGFEAGDIVSRDQVEPLLEKIAALGWTIADRDKILAAVPKDGEFLVAQLRTDEGRQFAREISQFPRAYDRLERLSKLPQGRQSVKKLIAGPDGYKLLEYMTTTPGGQGLGKQLSNAAEGRGFNQPTGRLYTVEDLLGRLEAAHARAVDEATAAAPQSGVRR